MLDIFYKKHELIIQNSEKKEIIFNTWDLNVLIDDFHVSYPWEYEKSGILLEVKEYDEMLFYNFLIDGIHLIIAPYDNFEIKEEILNFFWNVDILIIFGTKKSAKIFESIEAKIIIPYWEWKDIFLSTLWQNIPEISRYKVKSELSIDPTLFLNLV